MSRSQLLANRLTEVLLNGTWIANTNYKDQIERTTWMEATAKIDDLNTIAALIYHINYYLAGILHVFDGGDLKIRDKYSFDMPSMTSEEDWKNLVQEFISNSEAFITHVANMSDQELDKEFVKEEYGTYQRNIEGVIEHCYYHLGQVSLVRKLVNN